MAPTDVLTGLFFDYNGGFGPSLSFTSATTPTMTYGNNPTNLKLSATPGGWDFKQSSSSLSGLTQHYGLGTAGFGIFGGGTSSGGSGHPSNFGIVNSLYVNGENNSGIGLTTPYAKDSITFTFAVSGVFDTSKISNVRFQYGTNLNEGSTPGTFLHAPEPASLTLFGFGALGIAGVARRRRHAA
ncbi:MAG: PEP-CTERM sorting domain-containing protein [Planctomycetaceae bacterium]|nr:PEP-CTERM sorting domain-containing protein [Planctomycetaceae bacterium]